MALPKHDYETDVLVVGAGPVGLFVAWRLSQLGQPCMMIEKSLTTTVHPKMEYTNSRTAEIYSLTGLDHVLKPLAIPEKYTFNETWTTGFGGELLTTWERPSPEENRKQALSENDGTWSCEPRIRQMQSIFEAELKKWALKDRLVTDIWGYELIATEETEHGVLSTARNMSGHEITIKSRFMVGPLYMQYAHFKTPDIAKFRSHGQFWHAFFCTGSAVAQDEINTYTVHRNVAEPAPMTNPEEWVAETLGGMTGKPFPVKIDKMITHGTWKTSISVADQFRSAKGRVFICGDAAHPLSPAGGFGFNSGIQDGFDLTWKLHAYLQGYGGDKLLESFSTERRKAVILQHDMSEVLLNEVIIPIFAMAGKIGAQSVTAMGKEGDANRAELKALIERGYVLHDLEGIVLDYRYPSSGINIPDPEGSEPAWDRTKVHPSTWPGARAPHVFLSDKKTSIFHLYGRGFTLVDFTESGDAADIFADVARSMAVPLKKVHLPKERHCRKIWERDAVLVRPDGFVSWRCHLENPSVTAEQAKKVLKQALGQDWKDELEHMIPPEIKQCSNL
ncbi:FAD-dependent monooxygenase apdD [Hyphodiscus hymeniophilus]|uniref:FAD-dependent monooxygenase apdD n=1 Tax=Hyphodiscus hymeniophilus TaxID=353542 RepID=A0A9P7AW86_9HELO|nr:FAD-dependent monooxygenase apdD [Hyphodiscus hymeniophilus]